MAYSDETGKRVLLTLPRWMSKPIDLLTHPGAFPVAYGGAIALEGTREVIIPMLRAAPLIARALGTAAAPLALTVPPLGLLVTYGPLLAGIWAARRLGQQRREEAEQEARARAWRAEQRRKIDTAARTLWRGMPVRALEGFGIRVGYRPDRDEVFFGDYSWPAARFRVGRIPGTTYDPRTQRHYVTNPELFKRAVLRRLREEYPE